MIVDTNVHLSRWPFRRLVGDATADLVARLRKRNVRQAWAGSFDGILHKDIAGVNARLAADCRTYGPDFLVPFGSVNPRLPGWQEDLRRCAGEHGMPGIRLHPNYHQYELKDVVFRELFHLAAERKLVVQLVVSMEDTRTQHPLLRRPPVDLSALSELVKSEPAARLVLLNWMPGAREQRLEPLAGAGAVWFDIATVEGVEGIARLSGRVPPERIVFGSNFPLFYFEAALLKVQESGLPEDQKRKIVEENARRILSGGAGL